MRLMYCLHPHSQVIVFGSVVMSAKLNCVTSVSSNFCLIDEDKCHLWVCYSTGFNIFLWGEGVLFEASEAFLHFSVNASLSECESVKINTHTADSCRGLAPTSTSAANHGLHVTSSDFFRGGKQQ